MSKLFACWNVLACFKWQWMFCLARLLMFDGPSLEGEGRLELVKRCGFSSLFLASFGPFEWRKVIRLGGCLDHCWGRLLHSGRRSMDDFAVHAYCSWVCFGWQTRCLYRLMAMTPIKLVQRTFLMHQTLLQLAVTLTAGCHAKHLFWLGVTLTAELSCELFECWFRCSGFAQAK